MAGTSSTAEAERVGRSAEGDKGTRENNQGHNRDDIDPRYAIENREKLFGIPSMCFCAPARTVSNAGNQHLCLSSLLMVAFQPYIRHVLSPKAELCPI